MTCTAITKQIDGWWVGWIEEIPGVNCQELTHEELMLSLKEALADIIAVNRNAALAEAGADFREEPVAV
jgi:predicted RNase H-like HicB family nuclease